MSRAITRSPRAAAASAASHPAASLRPAVRAAAVATLLLGTGLQAASFLILNIPDSTTRFAWIAAHPALAETSKTFDVLAMPFLIGGAAVYVMLGRQRSPGWPGSAASFSSPAWSG